MTTAALVSAQACKEPPVLTLTLPSPLTLSAIELSVVVASRSWLQP